MMGIIALVLLSEDSQNKLGFGIFMPGAVDSKVTKLTRTHDLKLMFIFQRSSMLSR